MSFSRQTFEIDTDTGPQVKYGPPFTGEIRQARWVPAIGDTGADLNLSLLPDAEDTGLGWQFASYADSLGLQFTKAPRQAQHGLTGAADTGDAGVPIVAAGDRLKVEVVPGGAAVAGRLYVWTAE